MIIILPILQNLSLVFDIVYKETAVEPSRLRLVDLSGEEAGLFAVAYLVVVQLKELFICEDYHPHVSEVVHLRFPRRVACFGYCIVCWTELCMHIVARSE